MRLHLDALDFASNPALFGWDRQPGLVNLQAEKDGLTAYRRLDGQIRASHVELAPFLWLSDPDLLAGLEKSRKPPEYELFELEGEGFYRFLVRSGTWNHIQRISKHLVKASGLSAGHPRSPQLFLSNPAQQYLMSSGQTLFNQMSFADLRRLQLWVLVDIEDPEARADPAEDPLQAIALSDSSGWSEILSGEEHAVIARAVELIQQRDPDVIEGHDLFKFHLHYLYQRARLHGVELRLGRDLAKMHYRRSRLFIAEKTIDYLRWYVHGRDLVDSWILSQMYDVTGRELTSFELEEVGDHLEVQVQPSGGDWRSRAERHLELLRRVFDQLSYPYFIQAQIFPFRYEHVVLRGTATRIDSLFLREYLRKGHSVPALPEVRDFAGGLTAQEYQGIAKNVYHCDVASLYPSIILAFELVPEGDSLQVLPRTLADLKDFRLRARGLERASQDPTEQLFYQGLQTTFKILINSFYGYLGFAQGHFADFEKAAEVTSIGRGLLQQMIDWLKAQNSKILEVDTDGIYFQAPPEERSAEQVSEMIAQLSRELPDGVNVELDGHYNAMYCHKMKNYALLDQQGHITFRGSGLRSRSLEPFLREFLQTLVRRALEGQTELASILAEFQDRLHSGRVEAEELAKKETLTGSPAGYLKKVERGGRNRAAVYELALTHPRRLVAGDSLRYYVTGEKANVTVYNHCRLLKDFDPANPDINLKYYSKKLKDIYKKFAPLLTEQE